MSEGPLEYWRRVADSLEEKARTAEGTARERAYERVEWLRSLLDLEATHGDHPAALLSRYTFRIGWLGGHGSRVSLRIGARCGKGHVLIARAAQVMDEDEAKRLCADWAQLGGGTD